MTATTPRCDHPVWKDAAIDRRDADSQSASGNSSGSGDYLHVGPLVGNVQTDVLILGAGIAGLTTALQLLRSGRRVVVGEAKRVGAGTTAYSTGHLDATPEIGAIKLIDRFGDKARSITDLRVAAIDFIEQHASRDSDFRRISGFHYTENEDHEPQLRREQVAHNEIGLETTWHDSIELPQAASGFEVPRMGRINSRAYLMALAKQVIDAGGTIYEDTLIPSPTEDGPTSVETDQGVIQFDDFVAAGGCNFAQSIWMHVQAPAYQSYVCAVRTEVAIEDALYWDDDSPYHYVRRVHSTDPHWLMIGGADHRTGMDRPTESVQKLHDFVGDRYPGEITHTWSAEFYDNSDGVPLIGRAPGMTHHFVATGFSGTGLTWGTVAGRLIADLLLGNPVACQSILDPSRFGGSGLGAMAVEQTKSALAMVGYLTPDKTVDVESLQRGEGTVGKVDGREVAVCRDVDGCVHQNTSVCPHMGGRLAWNAAEQTWDCPLHGGRFAADGTRLYGPPEDDLTVPAT